MKHDARASKGKEGRIRKPLVRNDNGHLMGLCFFYSCSLSRLGFDWRGNVSSLLCHSREEEDSGMEGGLVVGYMQINSLGAGRAGLRDGHGWGRQHYCARNDGPLFASHPQFYRCPFVLLSVSLSLTQSLASLFFFFRTLALNLNSGSLGVSLLLMRPSLVNSYRAPLARRYRGRGSSSQSTWSSS